MLRFAFSEKTPLYAKPSQPAAQPPPPTLYQPQGGGQPGLPLPLFLFSFINRKHRLRIYVSWLIPFYYELFQFIHSRERVPSKSTTVFHRSIILLYSKLQSTGLSYYFWLLSQAFHTLLTTSSTHSSSSSNPHIRRRGARVLRIRRAFQSRALPGTRLSRRPTASSPRRTTRCRQCRRRLLRTRPASRIPCLCPGRSPRPPL